MSLLDKASILLTPTAYDTSELLSIKPDDGGGDFDFSRPSSAERINDSGGFETMASNVPRIDYTGGTASFLLEPRTTNLYLNSATLTTQDCSTPAVQHGSEYTVSFYGTGSITFSGSYTGSLSGTGTNDRVSLTFTVSGSVLTSTVSGTVTNAQLESNPAASTYIPTTSSIVTRMEEQCLNAGDSSLISGTEGVLYAEFAVSNLFSQNSSQKSTRSIGMSFNTGTNNVLFMGINPSNKFYFFFRANGSNVIFNQTISANVGQYYKVAFKYKSGETSIYIDGQEVLTSSNSFTISKTLGNLAFNFGTPSFAINVFQGNTRCVAVFKEALTDAELICLTS